MAASAAMEVVLKGLRVAAEESPSAAAPAAALAPAAGVPAAAGVPGAPAGAGAAGLGCGAQGTVYQQL